MSSSAENLVLFPSCCRKSSTLQGALKSFCFLNSFLKLVLFLHDVILVSYNLELLSSNEKFLVPFHGLANHHVLHLGLLVCLLYFLNVFLKHEISLNLCIILRRLSQWFIDLLNFCSPFLTLVDFPLTLPLGLVQIVSFKQFFFCQIDLFIKCINH